MELPVAIIPCAGPERKVVSELLEIVCVHLGGNSLPQDLWPAIYQLAVVFIDAL